MPKIEFLAWWVVFLVALVLLARQIGRYARYGGTLGILIDSRGRFSLTHFQIVLWTILILSSLLAVYFGSGFDSKTIQFPESLLGLMGVSVGSGVLATGVKVVKDNPASGARVARNGFLTQSNGAMIAPQPTIAQIWLQEEGDMADQVIDVTKYQNFVFTLIIATVYVTMALKKGGLPDLPENIVWLIGISHVGYVAGKVPNR